MSRVATPEPALLFDDDPRRHARQMAQLHAAFVCGKPTPIRPRQLVEASWNRMQQLGLVPEEPNPLIDVAAVSAEVEKLATAYGSRSASLVRLIGRALQPCLADSDLVGVLATSASRVGARFGGPRALRLADRIGFVDGAAWSEGQVGTNAIGLAAHLGHAVQIHGPEHWCRNQHAWSCAAAPITDPATGDVIAVIDISGAVRLGHPALLALVHSLARQLELHLHDAHRARLERLRSASSHSWPASRARGSSPTRTAG